MMRFNPINIISLVILIMSLVLNSCNGSIDKPNEETIPTLDTASSIAIPTDTIPEIVDEPVQESPKIDITNWTIDDFIVECDQGYRSSLKQLLEYEREEWSKIPNPIIAVYRGNDFGDYHHIIFENELNHIDFGHGNNDFGDIELFFESDDLRDNPKYLNQTFMIYWDWKISSFPCCEGDYEQVKAYFPSIIDLKLIEDNNYK